MRRVSLRTPVLLRVQTRRAQRARPTSGASPASAARPPRRRPPSRTSPVCQRAARRGACRTGHALGGGGATRAHPAHDGRSPVGRLRAADAAGKVGAGPSTIGCRARVEGCGQGAAYRAGSSVRGGGRSATVRSSQQLRAYAYAHDWFSANSSDKKQIGPIL